MNINNTLVRYNISGRAPVGRKLSLKAFLLIFSVFFTGNFLLYGQLAINFFDIKPQNNRLTYAFNQAPPTLISANTDIQSAGYTFSWQYSTILENDYFITISNESLHSLSAYPPNLPDVIFVRRLATKNNITTFSNILRIEAVSGNWETLNYTREHDILKPGIVNWKQADVLGASDKITVTQYFDGLGRPIQSVAANSVLLPANQPADMVGHYAYDALGRAPKDYLPYTTVSAPGKFKPNAPDELTQFYLSNYNDNTPFGQVVAYDESPLNRAVTIKGPGDAWSFAVEAEQLSLLNTNNDGIRHFTIGASSTDMPYLNPWQPVYPANSLVKQQVKDVNQKVTLSFFDDEGKLVCKKVQLSETAPVDAYTGWICTYYVYDAMGMLRCEISPEGVLWLTQNNWNFSNPGGTSLFNEQCFVYNYDFKLRTIYKKQPGQLPLFMIYDNRDRLIFTQDGNQEQKQPTKQWTAYRYDELDRVMVSALYNTNNTWEQLQNLVQSGTVILPLSNSTGLLTCTNCIALQYNYYDGFAYSGRPAFNASIAAKAAVAPVGSNQLPMVPTTRLKGFSTGSRVAVLGTTTLHNNASYFDNRGNLIQQISRNLRAANDFHSYQYAWDGRVLGSAYRHGFSGGVMSNYEILTRFGYDMLGRLIKKDQKYGTNAWREMVNQQYDNLGQVSGKRLSPTYNAHHGGIGPGGGGLEYQAFSYNIRGQMIGINKDFALKTGSYNKWGNFFGLYLAYATNEAEPGKKSLNGQMAAQVWNTQGDDMQRRYNYNYDAAGRLTEALFAQRAVHTQNWDGSVLNFHEVGTGGRIQYDLNGNIKSIIRHGFQMGNTAIVQVDNLQYEYFQYSNKLKKVTDITGNPGNGTAGDFKDGSNGIGDDYTYDHNGNLTTDHNKNIKNLAGTTGIRYNHLDKPEEIKIEGKGTIKITYDATGAKLKREFISATGGGTKVTWYMGAYQYEEVVGGNNPQAISLSFISFAEGRIRPITAENTNNGYDALFKNALLTLPGSKKGSIDYFITDHRSDVRMILTEETQWEYVTASMEYYDAAQNLGRQEVEQELFGDAQNNSRVTTPAGWGSNPSEHVSRLSKNTYKVGPSRLLKVMAGDLISGTVQYYYPAPVINTSGSQIVSDVVAVLSSLIGPSPATNAVVKGTATQIASQAGSNAAFASLLTGDASSSSGNRPKAYLNVVFFDERFIFVPEASQQLRVLTHGDGVAPLVLSNIRVPRNGYVMVFLSNESEEPVFFDDFKVRHDRGRILEENHYYAYGLKIAALSSKAFGGMPNAYQYQGDYSEFDDDLGWNDFMLRSYDPQIGRFLQWDPYDQFASGYVGMGNDPGNNVDPTGGFSGGVSAVATSATASAQQAGVGYNAVVTFKRVVTTAATVGQTGASAFSKVNTGVSMANTLIKTGGIVSDATSVNSNLPPLTPEERRIHEWRMQTIAAPDIFGNGHIGPRKDVEAKINRIKWNYYQQVGENVSEGVFGSAGYLIDGEEGSFVGAKVDQAVQAGAALQRPTVRTTLPQVPNRVGVTQLRTIRLNSIGAGGEKAKTVIDHAKKYNGAAQPGYRGGGVFQNDGRGGGEILPRVDNSGNKITYKEYDINPYTRGVNRGVERVVIGSDGRSYFTNDHYRTFSEVVQ
jgi:RHS repeat-associated protein